MAQGQMQRVRELIKAKKYDEARTLLKTINHPKAKEWLAKLDEMSPRSQPSTHDAAELLTKARQLIQSKQYDEARNLLEAIPDNPRAKQWLAKLDEIAPDDPFKNTTQQKSKNNQNKLINKKETQSQGRLFVIGTGSLTLLAILLIIILRINTSSNSSVPTTISHQNNATSEVFQNVVTGLVANATELPATATTQPRPTLPPTWTPTNVPRPTATPDTLQVFYDENGRGTKSDPYRYQTNNEVTIGLTNDSVLTIPGYIRDERLEDLVLEWNMFNTEPPANQQYISVVIIAQCSADSAETCNYSELNFQVIGSKGKVYDSEWLVTGNQFELADEVYGGGEATGQILFIVDRNDDNFTLIYKPNLFFDEAYFFEMREFYIE